MKKGLQYFLVIVVLFSGAAVYSKTASEVFDAVSSSVVVIRTYDANGNDQSLGSGVVVASDLVATNCHVIEDAANIQVAYKKKQYPATLRHTDWDRDVCTLTVKGINAPAVVMGSTSRLKVGARVYAIGAPQGLELTLSEGIISSLREVGGGQYLQISAPISPGSSGGGLFDEEGRLIGLPTFYLAEGQQLNFAVPVEWLNELPERNKKISEAEQTIYIDWLNKSVALEKKNDWAGLLTHSLRWTEAQPKEPMAWFDLGFAYYMLSLSGKDAEKNAEAIKAYQQALRINPEYVSAWINLGMNYDKTVQYAEAIKAYQQALRINPEDMVAWVAWTNLGDAYDHSDQYAEAIKAYKQALSINPEFALVWNKLGIAYDDSDQYAEAIKAYKQALSINPEDDDAWYNLGIAYDLSGQTSQVTEVYKVLKKLDSAKADEFFNKYVLP